ncbi:MAG: hypothetical protein KatS3mg085_450 [Candidatus Dojkabacteria bacterium]|nr:MAG: hypothetical protein KatS3mg085_450 [Candidatus Dojkabacteria bacterium]
MTNCKRLTQNLDESNKILWALDKYDEYGVLQAYVELNYLNFAQELLDTYSLKGIYLKRRFDTKLNKTELIAGQPAPKPYYCIENDLKFEINFEDYLDVGLFLDHRISRELVSEHCNKKDVLNLFSYTGSFSVYCADKGAKSVTSVDLSSNYIEWSKRNFVLNNLNTLAPNEFWSMDVYSFLELAIKSETQYDIIIIDPPSFSRNKSKTFQVQRDHKELIRTIQKNLLRTNGFIFFSTNLQDFVLDPYLRPGADKLTKQTVPEEFKPGRPHQSFVFYN